MEKLIHTLATSFLLIALMIGAVYAQTWTSTSGPLRPHVVKDLSSAVSSGQTLYAADAETLKVSTNGGTTWNTTVMPITNPLVVAVQPNNPMKVQVGRLVRLESSTDGGTNWNAAVIFDSNFVPLRLVTSAADTSVSLVGADTVLRAGWTTSLYRSTDAGLHWSSRDYFKDSAHTNVNDVVFHTHTPSYQKVWVGGSRRPVGQSPEMTDESGYSIHQKGVWYSSNNGAAWEYRGGFGSGTDRNVTALAFSTISGQAWSELLIAATSSLSGSTLKATLFQSTNGGTSWGTTVDLYSMLQVGLVRSIAVCWNDSNKMVAATDKGFAVSYNRGSNWALRNTGISDAQTCYRVIYDRALDSTVWLCTDGALYKSTNSGSTWSSASSVFGTMNVSGSSFGGGAAQAVSSSFSAIARQSGGSWVYPPRNVGLQQFAGKSVAINYTNSQYANAAGSEGGYATIYGRTDGGDSWTKVFSSDNSGTAINAVRTDPKASSNALFGGGTFYKSGAFKNFVKSTDYGATWTTYSRVGANDGTAVTSIAVDTTGGGGSSSTLYAGLDGGYGIRKSGDGGASWNTTQLNGYSILDVALGSSSVVYMSSSAGIWRSDDALGSNPTVLSPPFSTGAKRILMHPSHRNRSDHLWILTSDGQEVYKTVDAGVDWNALDVSSLPKPITDLQADPASNTLIYVGTAQGIFKTDPPPEAPVNVVMSGTNCSPYYCGSSAPAGPQSLACHPMVSWNANQETDLASSATYTVERSIDGGEWSAVATPTATSWTDSYVTLSSTGTHTAAYRVKAKDAAGSYSGYNGSICAQASAVPGSKTVAHFEASVAYEFKLLQNTPNPFNPTTRIDYSLPTESHVSLVVYDLLGRTVKTLVDDYQEIGDHTATMDASSLASGMYIYRLTAGPNTQIRKMMLLK